MIPVESKTIPENILKDSVLAHIAAVYFSLGRQLERKTRCSSTRGFILSTLRGGASLNKNEIARFRPDCCVQRAIKSLVQDGLVTEKKPPPAGPFWFRSPQRGANTAGNSSKPALPLIKKSAKH